MSVLQQPSLPPACHLSATNCAENDRRAKAERQLDKEREKLRVKQAAIERAKDKQRQRREADKNKRRHHSQQHTDTHTAAARREEEKQQEESRSVQSDALWMREEADREERLRQAEEQLRQLRMEREQMEADIRETRRQQQQQQQQQERAHREEERRRQELVAEREEEQQRRTRVQREEDEERTVQPAGEEQRVADRREAVEREDRKRTTAVDTQEDSAVIRQKERARQRQQPAPEPSRSWQAVLEEEEAAITTHSVGDATSAATLSTVLSDIVLPRWNISQHPQTLTRNDDRNHTLPTRHSDEALEPVTLPASSVVPPYTATPEVKRRPFSSSPSTRLPRRRSAWSIPVRPDSPSSVASAPSLLSRTPSWADNTTTANDDERFFHTQLVQRLARLHRRSLPALSSLPSVLNPHSRTSPSSVAASPSHSAPSEPVTRRRSLITAASLTPPRFSRQHLINAVTFSLLPSPSLLASRLTVLSLLQSTPHTAHLLLLLHASPTSSLTLRAVFAYRPESRDAASVWEGGSAAVGRVVGEEELDRMWKYDSGKKEFIELSGVRSFAPTSHAFTMRKRVR